MRSKSIKLDRYWGEQYKSCLKSSIALYRQHNKDVTNFRNFTLIFEVRSILHGRGGKMSPNFTPKPKIMETPNLA